MNKYTQTPDEIIDLHGHTAKEAEFALQNLMQNTDEKHVRIIFGKGNHSTHGPVLGDVVKRYLESRNISWRYAKQKDGGEGAIELSL